MYMGELMLGDDVLDSCDDERRRAGSMRISRDLVMVSTESQPPSD